MIQQITVHRHFCGNIPSRYRYWWTVQKVLLSQESIQVQYITWKWYRKYCKLGRIQKHKYIIVMCLSGEVGWIITGCLKETFKIICRPPFRSFCLAHFLCKPQKEGSGAGGGGKEGVRCFHCFLPIPIWILLKQNLFSRYCKICFLENLSLFNSKVLL